MGPCGVLLTVRFEDNPVLINILGVGGINLLFEQTKKWAFICLPGDGLQHLCSFGACPYRQCPKCHLWGKAQPKTCDGIRLCLPHVAHETKMDANLNGGVSMDPGTCTVTLAFSLHQLLREKNPQSHISVWTSFTGGSSQVCLLVMTLNGRGWWWLSGKTWMFEGFFIPVTDLLCSPGRLPPFLARLFTAAELHF